LDILPHEKQIHEYEKTIGHLKKQNQDNPLFNNEIKRLPKPFPVLTKRFCAHFYVAIYHKIPHNPLLVLISFSIKRSNL